MTLLHPSNTEHFLSGDNASSCPPPTTDDIDGAFEKIVQTYRWVVVGSLRSVIGISRDEEDLIQEVFIRLLVRLRQPGEISPGAWLRRVARNVAINELRRRHVEPVADAVLERDCGVDIEERAMERQVCSSVLECLSALPERQREALLLLAYGDGGPTWGSGMRTASAMKISDDAFESLVTRARRHLNGEMSRRGYKIAEGFAGILALLVFRIKLVFTRGVHPGVHNLAHGEVSRVHTAATHRLRRSIVRERNMMSAGERVSSLATYVAAAVLSMSVIFGYSASTDHQVARITSVASLGASVPLRSVIRSGGSAPLPMFSISLSIGETTPLTGPIPVSVVGSGIQTLGPPLQGIAVFGNSDSSASSGLTGNTVAPSGGITAYVPPLYSTDGGGAPPVANSPVVPPTATAISAAPPVTSISITLPVRAPIQRPVTAAPPTAAPAAPAAPPASAPTAPVIPYFPTNVPNHPVFPAPPATPPSPPAVPTTPTPPPPPPPPPVGPPIVIS